VYGRLARPVARSMGSGRRPPGRPWPGAAGAMDAVSHPSKNAMLITRFTSPSVANRMGVCNMTVPC
jgi:hypothetical protein